VRIPEKKTFAFVLREVLGPAPKIDQIILRPFKRMQLPLIAGVSPV
jgi:hypothetical protein